jgi:hypothetical protein
MAAEGTASFYEGPQGEARLERAIKHRAMLDRLFPPGGVLGDFYRQHDPVTSTPLQKRIHGELSRAVGAAIEVGEDTVARSLLRELATFVAAADILAKNRHQTQLAICFDQDAPNALEAMLA